MEIRELHADEIECRVQSVVEKGDKVWCILLLYKDARTDMKLLDETFGNMNWQRTHEVINGNLFCNIDIWDDAKKQWVRKQDVGTESNQQAEKGESSDSFKRAGFNIGIGRELYTAPSIFIELADKEFYIDKKDGKKRVDSKVKFFVKSIVYDKDKNITGLEIIDKKKVVRYTLKSKAV